MRYEAFSEGVVVATAIGTTYGFLYGLVIAEDYAVPMGAIAVFVALATVMLVTRCIDWYGGRADA